MSIEGTQSKGDAGFALFAVVSFLLIAGSIATPFFINTRIEALVARNVANEARARYVLSGLIELAAFRYVEKHAAGDAQLPTALSCEFSSGARIAFSFADHSGMIDLNATSVDLIALGFRSIGVEPSEATALAGDVLTFRTVAGSEQQAGVRPIRGGYKHGLFESVSELMDLTLLRGTTLEAIRAVFTTHSGSGTIDRDHAPLALRAVIASMPESQLPFVIEGSKRLPALSVRATVLQGRQPPRTGLAVVVRDSSVRLFQSVEPFRLVGAVSSDLDFTRRPETSCEEFFAPGLIAQMEALLT